MLGSATSGDDMAITGTSVTAQSLAATYTSGDPDGNGAPITLTSTAGALSIGTAEAHDALALVATGGLITAATLTSDYGAIAINATDLEHVTLGTIKAAASLTVNAMGGQIDTTSLTSGSDTSVAGGILNVPTITAGGNLTLTGTNAITATTLTAAHKLTITGSNGITLTSATSGDDMAITGYAVSAQSLTSNLHQRRSRRQRRADHRHRHRRRADAEQCRGA